jgi:hypothetical protein
MEESGDDERLGDQDHDLYYGACFLPLRSVEVVKGFELLGASIEYRVEEEEEPTV